MQLSHALNPQSTILPETSSAVHSGTSAKAARPVNSKYAFDEIKAYIAIRDGLLAEAEEVTTRVKLDSVQAANDFVAACLSPHRSPYEAQHLPEAEMARERVRCEAVNIRIAELRVGIATRACATGR
jgi:hypothetical protein